MTPTNRKPSYDLMDYWRDNWELLTVLIIVSVAAGYLYGAYKAGEHDKQLHADLTATTEVIEPEPTPQEIITVVDGVGCVMAPNMIFDKNTGYTTITLVCDPDMLYQHLPAMEVNNDE